MNPEKKPQPTHENESTPFSFFGGPEPCKSTATPPPFNPAASLWKNILNPQGPCAPGSQNQENACPVNEITPLANQMAVKKSARDFTMTSRKVGAGVAKNNLDDVIALMEALAYLGYFKAGNEYLKVKNWEANKPLPSSEITGLIAALIQFQTDKKLKDKKGNFIKDGAVDKGYTTFKALNSALTTKRADDPEFKRQQALEEKKKEQELQQKAISQIAEITADKPQGEVSGEMQEAALKLLISQFQTDFAHFQRLQSELIRQELAGTRKWETDRLMQILVHQLNETGWFEKNAEKDPDFPAKIELLRGQFQQVADLQSTFGLAATYQPEMQFLDRFGESPVAIQSQYYAAEESAAVAIIARHLPMLEEWHCEINAAGNDAAAARKAKAAQKKYDADIRSLAQAGVLVAGVFAPGLSQHETPANAAVLEDLVAKSTIPARQNSLRTEFDTEILKEISQLDEQTRDAVLHFMARPDAKKHTQIGDMLKRSKKSIVADEKLGKEAVALMESINKNPGTRLEEAEASDPEMLMQLHLTDASLQKALLAQANSNPRIVQGVLERLPGKRGGEMAFRIMMILAETGQLSTVEAPLALTFYEKIESGRDSWWSPIQAKYFSEYAQQLALLAGHLPDTSCGEKGDREAADAIGQELATSGYWIYEKFSGDMDGIAGHLNRQLPGDIKRFTQILSGLGELKGAEFAQDLFHQVMLQAMTSEQIWNWDMPTIQKLSRQATTLRLPELSQTLGQIQQQMNSEKERKAQFGYEEAEQEVETQQANINQLTKEKHALRKELNALKGITGEISMDFRGLASFYGEGHSDASTATVHWPGGASGVTIGKGFDFKLKTETTCAYLKEISIPDNIYTELLKAIGKTGDAQPGESLENPVTAGGFVRSFRKKYPYFQLTSEQQHALFLLTYKVEGDKAVRFLSNPAGNFTKSTFLNPPFPKKKYNQLPADIQDFLVDLAFQGALKPNGVFDLDELLGILQAKPDHNQLRGVLKTWAQGQFYKKYGRRGVYRWLILHRGTIAPELMEYIFTQRNKPGFTPEDAYNQWMEKNGGKAIPKSKPSAKAQPADATPDVKATPDTAEKVTPTEGQPKKPVSEQEAHEIEEFLTWYQTQEDPEADAIEKETAARLQKELEKKRAKDARILELEAELSANETALAESEASLAKARDLKATMDNMLMEGNRELTDNYISQGKEVVKAHTTDGRVDVEALAKTIAETSIFRPEAVMEAAQALPGKTYRRYFLLALVNEWKTRGYLPYLSPDLRQGMIVALAGFNAGAVKLLQQPETASKEACDRQELRGNAIAAAPGYIYGPLLQPGHFKSQSINAEGDMKLTDEQLFSLAMKKHGPGGAYDIAVAEKRHSFKGWKGISEAEARRKVHGKSCQVAAYWTCRQGGFDLNPATSKRYYALKDDHTHGSRKVNEEGLTMGVNAMDAQLASGKPVIVGVDKGYVGKNDNESTDHFIVIVGKKRVGNQVGYVYFDPGTSTAAGYDLEKNVLWETDQILYIDDKNYSVKKPVSYALDRIMVNP